MVLAIATLRLAYEDHLTVHEETLTSIDAVSNQLTWKGRRLPPLFLYTNSSPSLAIMGIVRRSSTLALQGRVLTD